MVALKAHEVDRFLAKPPEGIRLFLVYGSDSGAITERARALEQLALKRGRGEAVLRVGSDELSGEPGRVADEANSVSLFGGEPVISLRVLDGRHNVVGALQPLFERPPDAAWVIVEAGELNPTNALRKAFEASKSAATLPTFQAEGKDLDALIRAAADEHGITIEPAALELLAENLGGDRLAIRGELEKLFLYAQDQRVVTLADVAAIVGDTTESHTDQTIDAALLGDSEALETELGRMRAEASSFASLGATALRHLLSLQTLRAAMDDGQSASEVINYARPPIFSRRRSTIESELSRWPSPGLVEARRKMDQAIYRSRLQPSLEDAAISDALHAIALTSRRLKQRAQR
jgi:DNA polymerase-3 subunit delta